MTKANAQSRKSPHHTLSPGGTTVLLKIPLLKYSAMTENPSLDPLSCLKNKSWSLAFCSSFCLASKMARYSGAHSGHSFSLSPRQRKWNECMHMKCTAGRSRVKVQAVHLLSWNIFAFVFISQVSLLIKSVSSCVHGRENV
jgi:hypothetical protein